MKEVEILLELLSSLHMLKNGSIAFNFDELMLESDLDIVVGCHFGQCL